MKETAFLAPRPALVVLDADHPGFHDLSYRRRRDQIAHAALTYVEGEPAPNVAYTDEEQGVWREVWQNLEGLHTRYACREYLEASKWVNLSRASIPQLRAVNETIEPYFGFRMLPVAGLVTAGAFLRQLGQATFLSTQYMRHHSVPLYTPEPDIVHELIGHAATFTHRGFADLNRAFAGLHWQRQRVTSSGSAASIGTPSNSVWPARTVRLRSTAPDSSRHSASLAALRRRSVLRNSIWRRWLQRRTTPPNISSACSSHRPSTG